MRYADNQPVKECRECIQAIEAGKCRGCEAKTLQMFIVWIGSAVGLLFALVLILLATTYQAKADIVTLTNEGFVVGYDTEKRQPSWVQYDLEPSEVIVTNRASHSFRADPRLRDSDSSSQYKGLARHFDRGHLAPAADFNWSTNALKETYYFSNICPMLAKLNRGKWAENEAEVRRLAKGGTVHVVVYPVYRKRTWKVEHGFLFEVPERFVKVAWGWFGVRKWEEDNFDEGIPATMPL